MSIIYAPDTEAMTTAEREGFWIQNLREALKMMSGLTSTQVFLDRWSSNPNGSACGTVACFGGWLPHTPYFQNLGVIRSQINGSPQLYTEGLGNYRLCADEVAEYLFGCGALFDHAREHETAVYDSHHQIVLARITQCLRELGVEA